MNVSGKSGFSLVLIFAIFGYYVDIFNIEYYNTCILNDDTTILDRIYFLFNIFGAYVIYSLSNWFGVHETCFDNNDIQKYFFNNLEEQFTNNVDKSALKRLHNPNITTYDNILDGINYYNNRSKPIVLTHKVINAHEYNYNELKNISNNYLMPVVIKGFVTNTTAFNEWSPEYLTKKYGHRNVPMQSVTSLEPLRLTLNPPSCNYWNGRQFETIEEFFKSKANIPSNFDFISFWSFVNTSLYNEFGLNELGCEKDIKALGTFMNYYSLPNQTEMMNYLNNKIDSTCDPRWRLTLDFHGEPGPFITIQVKGHKIWRIIPGIYSHLMRPVNLGIYALSNVYNAEHFNKLPRYEILLSEGDVLIVPSWGWHEIHVKRGEFQASIGLRLFDFNSNIKTGTTLTINTIVTAFRNMIPYLFGNKRNHESFIDNTKLNKN